MNCGYGAGMESPPVSMQLHLTTGTSYEMAHPDGWHAVCPVDEPSYSLMVTGTPWARESHKPTKKLDPLNAAQFEQVLSFFRETYGIVW
jgi:hypothetical protein